MNIKIDIHRTNHIVGDTDIQLLQTMDVGHLKRASVWSDDDELEKQVKT